MQQARLGGASHEQPLFKGSYLQVTCWALGMEKENNKSNDNKQIINNQAIIPPVARENWGWVSVQFTLVATQRELDRAILEGNV